jgi:hypothetical protein
MRRTLSLLLLAAVACGGKSKPANPPPQLPPEKSDEKSEDKPAEAKDDEKPPAPAQAPPAPTGPVEATIPSPDMKVKLVSAGKGKKAALKFTPKAGTKQH